jgi:hypothetical protein
MANIHYFKRANREAVIQVYTTESAGGSYEVDIANLATTGETFNAATANVCITEIFWGAKKDKQIDISRKERGGSDVHGHYYFINAGSYNYNGFVDNSYSERNILVTFDGPGHVIIKVSKTGGYDL